MPVVLKSRLPQIAAGLSPRAMGALEDAVDDVVELAKARVPVETGALRDAIHAETVGPATFSVVAGSTDAFYGHMVEFGTKRTPARPFLIPAAEEGVGIAAARITAALRGL